MANTALPEGEETTHAQPQETVGSIKSKT